MDCFPPHGRGIGRWSIDWFCWALVEPGLDLALLGIIGPDYCCNVLNRFADLQQVAESCLAALFRKGETPDTSRTVKPTGSRKTRNPFKARISHLNWLRRIADYCMVD